MTPHHNRPQLRFPEFDGDWEGRRFGDEFFRSTERLDPQNSEKSFRCIELEHINKHSGTINGFVASSDQKSIKTIFKENDVLFGKLRPSLRKYYHAKFSGVCSSEIWVLKCKSCSSAYLYYLIQTGKFYYHISQSEGSKMPRANWDNISKISFKLPTLPEQQKIASFLTAADERITQLQARHEQLQHYKRGVMQRIFSQEIRFSDDDGQDYPDWQEKRLGEVCKLRGGFAFKSSKFRNSGIPIIRISNIDQSGRISSKGFVYYEKIENDENWILRFGDILIAMSGATTGKSCVYTLNEQGYLNQRVGVFKPFESLDRGFLTQFVFSASFKNELSKLLVAGAQPNISSRDIESIAIPYPSLLEQKKIADFLTSIDDQIEQAAGQIQQMQVWRRGLLQRMFV